MKKVLRHGHVYRVGDEVHMRRVVLDMHAELEEVKREMYP